MMRRGLVMLAMIAVLSAACSSSLDPAVDVVERAGDAYVGDGEAATSPSESDTQIADSADAPIERSDEPVVRVPANKGQVEATNWLARTYMDAGSVELVWSPVEGAKEYRLYRIATANADYDLIDTGQVDGADLVYEGLEYGHIDTEADTDTYLTYFIVAEIDDGTITQPRWTEALTIDDITPPTPITDLTAVVTADGVLLEWSPSSDDVEFAAYSVSILDGDQLMYIGGGADPSQSSFIDPEEFTGTRSYHVVGVDFHDNRSESAQVDVVR